MELQKATAKNKREDRRTSWAPPWLNTMPSDGSTELMKEVRRKRALMEGPVLFTQEAQAPAPSKDYCSIVISKKGVLWRKWRISLRGLSSGSAPLPQPTEECLSHLDFRCDDALVEEVKRVFGPDSFSRIESIVTGCRDFLTCLPERVMHKILLHLDLQSILNLSYTSRFMQKFCNADSLWKDLYSIHHAAPTPDILELGKKLGWKKIFYMNKIQLQMELSRRRKHQSIGTSK